MSPPHKPQEQNGDQPQKDVPQLGALEEDDEFEEFAAEGTSSNHGDKCLWSVSIAIDWAEAEEDKDDSHFWEDNWDDDDIEDDFSKQLRYGFFSLSSTCLLIHPL